MIRPIALSLTFAFAASVAASGPPAEPPPRPTAEDAGRFVDAFLTKEREQIDIPGVVVAVVSGDEVLLLGGYGTADLERDVPVDPERTLFRVGSVSKTLTALAVLTEVERGALALDAEVETYLHGITIRPSAAGMTPFHLLTHTAGFDESFLGQHVAEPRAMTSLGDYLARHLTARDLPVGRVISYNDYGTTLAGHLVERSSDMAFADFMAERVLGPLGMTRSTFQQVDMPGELASARATAYSDARGRRRALPFDFILTTPSAGMWSTAADMARLLRALVGTAVAPLTNPVRDAMLTRQFAAHPDVDGRGFGFATRTANGLPCFYKDGQASGFSARIFVLPEQRFAIFSAHNLSIFGPRFGFTRAASFHRRLHEALLDRYFSPADDMTYGVAATDPDPSRDLSRFAGVYRDVVDPSLSFEKAMLVSELEVRDRADGTLVMGGSAWTPAPVAGVAGDRFQYHQGGPYYRAFLDGPDGQPRFLLVGGGTYERIGRHQTQRFQMSALGVGMSVLLVAAIVVPLRRRRHPVALARSTVAVAALFLTFAAGFAAVFLTAEPQRLVFQAPSSPFLACLTVGVAAVIATLLLAVRTAIAHGRRERGRMWPTIVSIAALVCATVLHAMNLIGFRY